jgi:DNA-3-methyladenine glycosylase I
MASYCEYVREHPEDILNKTYHDKEYGFPLSDDASLLERFALEINQAGLSWGLMLKRKDNFHLVYEGFDIDKLAGYKEQDVARILSDARIIRNRLKVNAVIENARRIKALRREFGSFQGWLETNSPLELRDWTILFKKTFVFTGGEIVREFLVSVGYLPGAHDFDCPIYEQISQLKPAWMRNQPGNK